MAEASFYQSITSSASILIVEDDSSYSQLIKKRLEKQAVCTPKILLANYFFEAKNLAQTNSFDLILLDLMLPDMQGVNTYQEISKIYPHATIWVITGSENDSNLNELKKNIGPNYFFKGNLAIKNLVEFIDKFFKDITPKEESNFTAQKLQRIDCDPNMLINLKVEEFNYLARTKNIQLNLKLYRKSQKIFLDPKFFLQIINDLFVYVLERAKSKILIETQLQNDRCSQLIVSFTDDGKNLSDAEALNVLSTNKNDFLKVCKDTLKLMGGTMDTENKKNVGVTFSVTLPTHVRTTQPFFNKLIMVVDDDPSTCYLLAKRLRIHQYECLTMHSVEEAIEHLKNTDRPPDLVLLDLGLTKASGFALLSHMRIWNAACKKVPVIVISGYRDRDIVEYALSTGAQAFLAKPYRTGDLLKTITSYLH